MEGRKVRRSLWSWFLGLALALGLLCGPMPPGTIPHSGVEAGPAGAAWGPVAFEDTTHLVHTRAQAPTGWASPHDQAMPPGIAGTAGYAPPSPAGWGEWDSMGVRYPAVITDSGTFEMWYVGVDPYHVGRIGYATSPDGANWTKHPANPVLDLGAPGEWDAQGLEAPFVVKEGSSSYKMWYSGQAADGSWRLGYATSSDGANWTKYAGNPVLEPGAEPWNNLAVHGPSILYEGGLYKMWLMTIGDDGGGNQSTYIAHATSTDGISWTLALTNPLFSSDPAHDWESMSVWGPSVLHTGGDYHMWYSAWGTGGGCTGYATAPDETTWTKYNGGAAPVLSGTGGEWDEGRAFDPFVHYADGLYTMWYDNSAAIGRATSTNGITWTKYVDNPVLMPGARLFLDVNYSHDWAEIATVPFSPVTVTVAGKASVVGEAGGDGWFRSYEWTWDPEQPEIAPGDTVLAEAAGLTTTVDPIGTIDGDLDLGADIVSGTIQAPWFSPLTLTVRCEVWEEFGPTIEITGVAADGGNYLCDFSGQWDIRAGEYVAVRYLEPDGDTVISVMQAPWMRVCYGDDWVGGNYPAGHTFWITVTDHLGGFKGAAEIDTQPGGGWGSDGFQTDWDQWTPQQPDIEAGDWVTFHADDGYSNTVAVGTVSGYLDVDTDTLTGTISATFAQSVTVECHPWGGPGDAPDKEDRVLPDGADVYACSWDPLSEWDILPAQDVAAMYIEPDDGDRIINVFREPAPHLRVEKWTDGNPGEGGNLVFQIQYRNDGDAGAEATVITDTMQGLAYITDTSGFPHSGSGSGPIVWDLGTVAPGDDWIQFDLFVQVTAAPSDTVTNTARIATGNPYDQGDPGEKESTWSGHVEANDTHLNVGKWAWTGDPAPGYDFVYAVNVCNDGSTGSSEVILTDTLHPSTTLQYWWAQSAGWQEVAGDSDLLVLSRPSLNGWSCEEVYLRVHLDGNAWPGMDISNTAVISAGNDMEDDDNETTWWGQVREPYTNLSIDKQLEWGQLVPGGEIGYSVRYNNNGNTSADHVLITDTLPVSTTFSRSWLWTDYGEPPVTPTVITDDYVVWEIGTFDNGYGYDMGVALTVDGDAPVGTVLTNTAEISPQPDENTYEDNHSTWVESLHDFGPNLRVDKYYRWENEDRIFYGIAVKNLGSTQMEQIWITDTYPLSTTSDGAFWVGHGPWFTYTHDAANRRFIIWAQDLGPGNTGHVGFWVDRDEPIWGVDGLILTNTVEAPWPGDVDPADNVDVEVAYTGPDLYVEKTLVAGDPLPGEIITFSLRFGNSHEGGEWWWDMQGEAWLTDTLPNGLEYLTSSIRYCDPDRWCPYPYDFQDGNRYIWHLWSMSAGDWNEIYLTARITDAATGLDTLTNEVEIASDQPISDTEPYYDNNSDLYDLAIPLPYFEVGKVYESSQVAGLPATYWLTVTNRGHEPGTNVVLSDTLPAGMVYGGGDGNWTGSAITWTFGTITAGGGTASGWFSGTLPCTGTVTNDDYRVIGSDQGVTSLPGGPVAFDVIAPALAPAFDQSTTSVSISTTVHFTDTSTTDGTPIASWAWDFGDGSPPAFTPNASHVYVAGGVFTVSLTITDTCGYSDGATATVTVSPVGPSFRIFLPLVLRGF